MIQEYKPMDDVLKSSPASEWDACLSQAFLERQQGCDTHAGVTVAASMAGSPLQRVRIR